MQSMFTYACLIKLIPCTCEREAGYLAPVIDLGVLRFHKCLPTVVNGVRTTPWKALINRSLQHRRHVARRFHQQLFVPGVTAYFKFA